MFDNRQDRDEDGRQTQGNASAPTSPGKMTLTQRLVRRPSIDAIADAVVQRLARGSSTGAPLPVQLRGQFEQSLGADLGGVRVHTGGDAADAASVADARAFALGQDVYFGSGNYDPDSDAGQHLIAHEVAHTVQQQGAEPTPQFALAVSQPGDASEAEADTAAAAMVAGVAAPRLSLAPVQRIAREHTGAPAVAPGMAVPSIDVIYEQIAHRMVYAGDLSTADRADLTRWGYRPTAIINLPGDLSLLALPSAREGVAPVLAFKGTLETVDWIEDMNSYGVGMFQFSRNEGSIHVALASLHGGATITGHSLGGALAQITAAIYPGLCSTVVTFQAPGIPQELIDGMRSRPEGRRITARHHVMTGDVVSHAGEGHLPGTRFTHTTTEDAIAPWTAHQMMPLSSEAAGAGVLDDITGNPDTPSGPGHASAVTAIDRDESSAGWAEMGRHVGSGLAGDVDEEMYVQVWQEVRAAADAGNTRWPELWSMCERVDDRAEAMRQNLQDLFPELSAAGSEEARVTAGELTSADSFVAAVDARRGGTLTDAQRTRLRAYYAVIPSRPAPRVIAEPLREPGVMRLARGSVTPDDPGAIAAHGVSSGGGALPHLDTIQAAFGRHDVSAVPAHQGGAASDAARSLDAQAYAFGGAVAFDGAPDLHTAAHEAAHVVQQRGGVQLRGEVSEPGDPFEVHADAVADAVVRGESAEALLDPYAGGAASQQPVQRLVRETGVDAVATVQRMLSSPTTTVHERGALREELDRAITDAHSVGTVVEIGVAFGGEIYWLTLPIEDAIALRGELGPATLPEASAPAPAPVSGSGPRRGPPRHVTVTDMRSGFRTAVAAAIHTAGGLDGETFELEIALRVPIEGPLHLLGSIRLEVEHGAEGYHVTAEPHVGIGLGTSARGELIGGITLEALGHDEYAATDLLALALEQELRAASNGPPPPFLVVILGSIALVAPELAAAILALDVAGRLVLYAGFGEPEDPFMLAMIGALYGEGYEAAARARMRRGEYVESADSASLEGHAERGGHEDRTEVEGEGGMSRHRRTEVGEDGTAHDAHFDLVDLRFAVELLGRFNAEIELHIDTDPHSRRGGLEAKVGLHGHHVAPAVLIAGEVVVALIHEFERIRGEHAEAAGLHLPSASDVTAALGGLGMAMFSGSIPHAEMGFEFGIEVPANREEHARACLRIIEGGAGDEHLAPVTGDAGEHPELDAEVRHSREVWGPIGG